MSGDERAALAASPDRDWQSRRVVIVNRRGLHARAAAQFVKLAQRFAAEIEVIAKGNRVSGLSIMGLLMLSAGPGTEIDIFARGRDQAAALEALAQLVAGGFDEDVEPETASPG